MHVDSSQFVVLGDAADRIALGYHHPMLLVLLVLVVLLLLLLLVVEIGRFDGSIDGCVDGFRTASGQRRCAASEANGFDVTAQERRQCRPVVVVAVVVAVLRRAAAHVRLTR